MAETAARTMLAHSAYHAILEFIRDGVYAPGEPIREEEVAKRLGMSRTPVREAMGRLQEKGLLQAAQGRGLAVSTLSMEQLFELYAMRGELEALVARFAAQHATSYEIANLRNLNEQFAISQLAREAARRNRSFHAALYDAARNRYLRAAVEDLHETIALLPTTTFTDQARLPKAVEEHVALIEAIAARNADVAAELARRHIAESLTVRLKLIHDRSK
ncbi:GntR family transcriptional regulator [Devosia sp. CN2-171]|uniref:GntR family transcriptional regulator n=1 Tax=Devosia sp. CN2-171 TaxID=3400909 RepID=UPI003BF8C555